MTAITDKGLNQQVRDVSSAIEPSYGIECHSCGEGAFALATASQWAAAVELHKAGWRVDRDRIRCPECVENDL